MTSENRHTKNLLFLAEAMDDRTAAHQLVVDACNYLSAITTENATLTARCARLTEALRESQDAMRVAYTHTSPYQPTIAAALSEGLAAAKAALTDPAPPTDEEQRP